MNPEAQRILQYQATITPPPNGEPESAAVNSNGGNINISSECFFVQATGSIKGISTENEDVPAVIKAGTGLGISGIKDGVAVYPQTSTVEVLSGDYAGVVELNGQNEIKQYKERKKATITVNNPKNENGVYYAEYTGKAPEIDISAVDAETGEPIELSKQGVCWFDEDENMLEDPATEIGTYGVLIVAGSDDYTGSVDITFEIIPPAESEEYEFIEGNNGDWSKNEDGSISFHINGDIEKFVGIEIDGESVDESNYTVEEGSTIVTLKADYLATISSGTHEIMFIYTDGGCSTEFTVDTQGTTAPTKTDEGKKSPDTGNESGSVMLAICAIGVGLGVLGLSKKSRKAIQ